MMPIACLVDERYVQGVYKVLQTFQNVIAK